MSQAATTSIRANARRLVAESAKVRDRYPVLSGILALEAADTTLRFDGTLLPSAFEALLNSTINLGATRYDVGEKLRSCSISPGGRWLVTGWKTLKVWDLSDPAAPSKRELPYSGFLQHALVFTEFIETDKLLFLREEEVHSLDLSEPNLTSGDELLVRDVQACMISPKRDQLWTLHNDSKIQLWDLEHQNFDKPLRELNWNKNSGTLAVSANGRWFAASRGSFLPSQQSWGTDNTISLWDLSKDDPDPAYTLKKDAMPGHGALSLSFSPDGRWLAASGDPSRIWDLGGNEVIDSPMLLERPAYRVGISPDGKWLATCGDGMITLRPMGDEGPSEEFQILRTQTVGLWNLSFSSNSKWLAVSSEGDRKGYLWDLEEENPRGSMIELIGHRHLCENVNFSNDSKWLATVGWDKTIRTWNLSSEKITSPSILHLPKPVYRSEFSPDGKWLFADQQDGHIRLWKFRDGTTQGTPIILKGETAQYSPHGRWLVARGSNAV